MSGYRRRMDPRTGQRYYEHRAVAEWHLGRPLEPHEVVHHINDDKTDGHPPGDLARAARVDSAGKR